MQRQTHLPFAMGEANRAERLNLLGLALTRVEADLYLATFCRWVFNVTAGGREDGGELSKTHRELASRPWGLCCSVGKARSTVGRARQLGLVSVRDERYVSGGQRANGYTIDWCGIRSMLGLRTSPAAGGGPRVPAATTAQGDALTAHPPATTAQGGALTAHPYKEIPSLCPSLETLSVPGPGPVLLPTAETGTEEIFKRAPLLIEARGRVVRPLPAAGYFQCGVFAGLSASVFSRTGGMVAWFRRQLSAARPVAEPNEAELILVMAAARHALRVPAAEVRRSREAIFAAIVGRRLWHKVQSDLPAAVEELQRFKDRFGSDLLVGDAWPPPEGGRERVPAGGEGVLREGRDEG